MAVGRRPTFFTRSDTGLPESFINYRKVVVVSLTEPSTKCSHSSVLKLHQDVHFESVPDITLGYEQTCSL